MNNLFSALVLGVVQGLTEFLPVSSSGHLVIFKSFFPSFPATSGLFEIFLHAGTLLSILYYFRKTLLQDTGYLRPIIIGTIPAVVVGFLLRDHVDVLFSSLTLVGFALLFTGLVNIRTSKSEEKSGKLDDKSALFIGIFQAIAIIPGVSRSGSTIFAGVSRGVARKESAKFSFLLSIPAVLGANLLEFSKINFGQIDFPVYVVGFFAAFLSGLFAIGAVFKFLKSKRFYLFGYYCLAAGAIVLITALF